MLSYVCVCFASKRRRRKKKIKKKRKERKHSVKQLKCCLICSTSFQAISEPGAAGVAINVHIIYRHPMGMGAGLGWVDDKIT